MEATSFCPRCGAALVGGIDGENCPRCARRMRIHPPAADRRARNARSAADPIRGALDVARMTYLALATLGALAFVSLTVLVRADGRDATFDSTWIGVLIAMLAHALAAAIVRVRPAVASVAVAALNAFNLYGLAASGRSGFALVGGTAITTLTTVLAWKLSSPRAASSLTTGAFSWAIFAPFSLIAVIASGVFFTTPTRPSVSAGEVVLLADFDDGADVTEPADAPGGLDAAVDTFLTAWESEDLDIVCFEFPPERRDDVRKRLSERFRDAAGTMVWPDLSDRSIGAEGSEERVVRFRLADGDLIVTFERTADAWGAASIETR